jgi:hypothetical protein
MKKLDTDLSLRWGDGVVAGVKGLNLMTLLKWSSRAQWMDLMTLAGVFYAENPSTSLRMTGLGATWSIK